MGIKLYVDDLRKCPEGWVLVRTNTDAIRLLATGGVDQISIDHDIVDKQLNRNTQETFQPVAYYIAVMKIPPSVITLHTANPEGALRMQGILNNAGIHSTYIQGSYHFEVGEDVK